MPSNMRQLMRQERAWCISTPYVVSYNGWKDSTKATKVYGKLALLVFLMLWVTRAFAGGLADELLAHYRLDTNGLDSLGKSPPFVVTNGDQLRGGATLPAFFKITNAPFTNGVLYIDGRYEPNGHFVHYLGTAPITNLRYESFTVSLDFYPLPKKRTRSDFNSVESKLDSWTGGRYARWLGFDDNVLGTYNILTGGYSYRWIGFNRQRGLLNLTLNNQTFLHTFKGVAVKPGRWHELICSVDLQQRRILTMFDGRFLEAITLPADFKLEVIGGPTEATEREFTFGNYSNGSVFYGYAAHLKLLGRALTEPELVSLYAESASERPNFPKPQLPWSTVLLGLGLASLVFFFLVWLRIQLKRPRDGRVATQIDLGGIGESQESRKGR